MSPFQRQSIGTCPQRGDSPRRGAAVVECALTAPLLVLAIFAAVEVGQYVNIAQAVCNASRIGARVASRQSTITTATVDTEVKDYLASNGIPRNGITVTVRNSAGVILSGATLASVTSGDRVTVTVSVQFSVVRRVSFLSSLNGASNTSKTTMRRE